PLASDAQALVAVATAGMRIAAGHSAGEAAVLRIAFPPFARLETEVALRPEALHEGGRGVDFGDELPAQGGVAGRFGSGGTLALCLGRGEFLWAQRRIVAGDAVLVGVETGRQSGQGGTAQGRGHVAPSEERT